MSDLVIDLIGSVVANEVQRQLDLTILLLQEPTDVLLMLLGGSITMMVFFGGMMLLASCLMRDLDLILANIILILCGSSITLILFLCALTDNAPILGGIMFVFVSAWAQIMIWITTQKTAVRCLTC